MQKENIIINSIDKIYQTITYIGSCGDRRLKSIEVEFLIKGNYDFKGMLNILTNKPLSEEEIKDKIIEVLK